MTVIWSEERRAAAEQIASAVFGQIAGATIAMREDAADIRAAIFAVEMD
jgi:hypothetical protein